MSAIGSEPGLRSWANRINMSMAWLAQGDYSVGEAGLSCGFSGMVQSGVCRNRSSSQVSHSRASSTAVLW